jgi:hypothetical protein
VTSGPFVETLERCSDAPCEPVECPEHPCVPPDRTFRDNGYDTANGCPGPEPHEWCATTLSFLSTGFGDNYREEQERRDLPRRVFYRRWTTRVAGTLRLGLNDAESEVSLSWRHTNEQTFSRDGVDIPQAGNFDYSDGYSGPVQGMPAWDQHPSDPEITSRIVGSQVPGVAPAGVAGGLPGVPRVDTMINPGGGETGQDCDNVVAWRPFEPCPSPGDPIRVFVYNQTEPCDPIGNPNIEEVFETRWASGFRVGERYNRDFRFAFRWHSKVDGNFETFFDFRERGSQRGACVYVFHPTDDPGLVLEGECPDTVELDACDSPTPRTVIIDRADILDGYPFVRVAAPTEDEPDRSFVYSVATARLVEGEPTPVDAYQTACGGGEQIGPRPGLGPVAGGGASALGLPPGYDPTAAQVEAFGCSGCGG